MSDVEIEGWRAVARNVWRRHGWEIVVDRRLRDGRITVELLSVPYLGRTMVSGTMHVDEADEARAVRLLAGWVDGD